MSSTKYKAVFSKKTHDGKVLECFGFANREDGGVSLMRWVQTPYNELATPPVIFDISAEEWDALMEVVKP